MSDNLRGTPDRNRNGLAKDELRVHAHAQGQRDIVTVGQLLLRARPVVNAQQGRLQMITVADSSPHCRCWRHMRRRDQARRIEGGIGWWGSARFEKQRIM